MLYRDHAEGESLFAKVLNVYATWEDAARANINRIEFLGEKIRKTIAASSRERVRIASVGCGPAREIAALLAARPELGQRLDVALIDQEERSITYCERTLAPFLATTGVRIEFIRESVRKLLTTRQLGEALGSRELIYSAGLFDYLSDRTFSALLAALWGALAPGGTLAVTVPRWLPERVCWALSDEYHANEGGHIRIYKADELRAKLEAAGLVFTHQHHAHALHSPFWWIKCAVGVQRDQHPLVRGYHQLLVWDMMKAPAATRIAEKALNPLIGKSVALYFTKPL